MSQESVTVTYSLEEILSQITQKLDGIDQKIDRLEEKFEQKFDRIEERLTTVEITQARLEEKIDGLSKRLDNQEFINRGVLIGLMVAILGGLAKIFGLVGNPS